LTEWLRGGLGYWRTSRARRIDTDLAGYSSSREVAAGRTERSGPRQTRITRKTNDEEQVTIELPKTKSWRGEIGVPNSRGLVISVSMRVAPLTDAGGGIPPGTRGVSLFLVNEEENRHSHHVGRCKLKERPVHSPFWS
jgi:hypothetical protein